MPPSHAQIYLSDHTGPASAHGGLLPPAPRLDAPLGKLEVTPRWLSLEGAVWPQLWALAIPAHATGAHRAGDKPGPAEPQRPALRHFGLIRVCFLTPALDRTPIPAPVCRRCSAPTVLGASQPGFVWEATRETGPWSAAPRPGPSDPGMGWPRSQDCGCHHPMRDRCRPQAAPPTTVRVSPAGGRRAGLTADGCAGHLRDPHPVRQHAHGLPLSTLASCPVCQDEFLVGFTPVCVGGSLERSYFCCL